LAPKAASGTAIACSTGSGIGWEAKVGIGLEAVLGLRGAGGWVDGGFRRCAVVCRGGIAAACRADAGGTDGGAGLGGGSSRDFDGCGRGACTACRCAVWSGGCRTLGCCQRAGRRGQAEQHRCGQEPIATVGRARSELNGPNRMHVHRKHLPLSEHSAFIAFAPASNDQTHKGGPMLTYPPETSRWQMDHSRRQQSSCTHKGIGDNDAAAGMRYSKRHVQTHCPEAFG